MYCFDTDVISATLLRHPPMHLIRRLALTPNDHQWTTAITIGELTYGAARRGSAEFSTRLGERLADAQTVLPFDRVAAEIYGGLRAELARAGKRLDEPDLRIASIALSRDLTLVTGSVKHFSRVPGLKIENWLEPPGTS